MAFLLKITPTFLWHKKVGVASNNGKCRFNHKIKKAEIRFFL
jgi:hypothetical protein